MFSFLTVLAAGALLGGGFVHAFVMLLIMGLVFWVLWWALGALNPPEPFKKVLTVVLVVAACIVVINFLLGLAGSSTLF
jgi:hypothetical protein